MQVLGVKQGDKHAGQFVHLVGGDHIGERDGDRQLTLNIDVKKHSHIVSCLTDMTAD